MKRKTLTSVLYYTLITIGILTTVISIIHTVLPDGFLLVNSILERPFFTVDANTTDFHIVVLSILTVVSFLIYAEALATCLLIPCYWYDIYDFLSFLYPEHTDEPTEEPTPVVIPDVMYTMPRTTATEPTIIFDYGTITTTVEDNEYVCTTITDLPHVVRVITGTEPRTVYVYNVITGDFEVMKEDELYKNKNIE